MATQRRTLTSAAAFALGLALVSACTGARAAGDEKSGELVVFAAASLTDAFSALETEFEARYPRIDVKLSFAGSQSLRTQILNGARAHVFASANRKHVQLLSENELVVEQSDFARNQMVVAVPLSNPAGLQSFADLPKAKRIVVAGDTVPAGVYAAEILQRAQEEYGKEFGDGVEASIVSRETHVRQTLQKVVLGEADAAIVYASDASSSSEVKSIAIPDNLNVDARYPIAVIDARAPEEARARLFINFVRSAEGAAALRDAGFVPIVE